MIYNFINLLDNIQINILYIAITLAIIKEYSIHLIIPPKLNLT